MIMYLNQLDVTVNEANYRLDVPPKLVKDKTFVPARFLAEQLGWTIEWNAASKEVYLTTPDTSVRILVPTKQAWINGSPMLETNWVHMEDDRIMLPLRWFAEASGAVVTATNQQTIPVEIEFDRFGEAATD